MIDANIAATIRTRAMSQGSQPAVICPNSKDRGGSTRYNQLSYQQLDELSEQLARGLLAHGIGNGTRTAFMVKPSIEFFALTFALFRAKAVPVLIDPGIGLKQIKNCLAEAQAESFIGIPAAHAARIVFRWRGAGWKKLVSVSRGPGFGKITYQELLKAGAKSDAPLLTTAIPDETAAILFTSGSTGAPKGAVYTHGNFQAQIRLLQAALQIKPGEIDLCTFPLFALFAPAFGMTAVIPEMDFTRPGSVDPLKIKAAIERFGVTNLFGSPALIKRVGSYGAQHGWNFPSIKRVLSAGAPVQASVIEEFRRLLSPDCQFFTPYGATECLPVAFAESELLLKETRFATEKGAGICVGYPATETELRILRISDKALAKFDAADCLGIGEIGEIAVCGPQRTIRYEHRDEATRLAKTLEKNTGLIFHRMGDLGYLDAKGRLWFCGRKSQRVHMTKGELYTIPCEGIFNQHPQVSRTALVGLGPAPLQIPAICVELRSGVPSSKWPMIEKELRQIGRAYGTTRQIQHFYLHPEFPVDIRHNAKIFREKLKPWAEAQWRKKFLSLGGEASLAKPSSVSS